MENGLAVLKDNMLVNVGEAYIVVNLLPEGAEEQGRSYDTLKLKCLVDQIMERFMNLTQMK